MEYFNIRTYYWRIQCDGLNQRHAPSFCKGWKKQRRRIGYELYQFVIAESLKMENMILKIRATIHHIHCGIVFPTIFAYKYKLWY